jgi:hypothetical protein
MPLSSLYFLDVYACNTDRIVSFSCHTAQGGQGKYCHAAQGDCHMSLLPTVLLTNVSNVNDPLHWQSLLGQYHAAILLAVLALAT